MKKKADLMLKRGSISEAQHKKLHAKADVEIAKAKALKKAKPAPSGDVMDDDDVETGADTPTADDPSAKTRKPGPAKVTVGEPADPDL
jgi:hypothetical protein